MSPACPKHSKPIVGLAGGIGSGKSTVARVFASLGAAVIDSDRISHEQMSDPDIRATLRKWWGERVISAEGEVDRNAVASIVFADREELERLERLLYPRIRRRREALITEFDDDPSVRAIVLDTPKLYESGLEELCDAVVFVDAARPTRVERIAATRGWSESEFERRENLQNPLDTKKSNADYLLLNHSGIDALRPQVERILTSVLASFE